MWYKIYSVWTISHIVLLPLMCVYIYIYKYRRSSHIWFQEFSVINPSILLQDFHHALIRCLISLPVCAVLYVITSAPSFISSPGCAHLSPCTCQPLFMFLHLILCCPSSNCIFHATQMIKYRMTILTSYFPCLAARFFPRRVLKDFRWFIRHHSSVVESAALKKFSNP